MSKMEEILEDLELEEYHDFLTQQVRNDLLTLWGCYKIQHTNDPKWQKLRAQYATPDAAKNFVSFNEYLEAYGSALLEEANSEWWIQTELEQ